MQLETLLENLRKTYPHLTFKPAETFYWSPKDSIVYYNPAITTEEATWALLHETAHGLLNHTQYYSDIELVKMESAAWDTAKELADELQITISEDHIQDCLDSYRDWLHKRSLCPACKLSTIQINTSTYTCVFCHKKWHVTSERFCRPYRKTMFAR